MKNKSIVSIVLVGSIVLFNNHSLCMETNTKIGPIDTLIIQRYMKQIGYKAMKRNIEHHDFEFKMLGGKDAKVLLTEESPFYIEFLCHKNSKSKLSQKVFPLIEQTPKHVIDKCTTWAPTAHPAVVQVTAAFYNKEALITMLNRLHRYEKQQAAKQNQQRITPKNMVPTLTH